MHVLHIGHIRFLGTLQKLFAVGGAVASLRNIKNPAQVALKVMQTTDHVLLVGEGAREFARLNGFQEENLLTEKARERFQSILDDDPEYPAALLGMGMLHVRLGEREAAEDAYQRLSVLEGAAYKPLYGQILAVNGKTEEAIAEFRRLLAEDSSNRNVRKRLVSLLLSNKRLEEAETILTESLEAYLGNNLK